MEDRAASVEGIGRSIESGDAQALSEALRSARSGELQGDGLATVLDAIARRASSGDRAALEALLEAVQQLRLAESAIRSYLIDDADVADCVQSTMIRISESIGGFRAESRFSTWCYRIAKNEALQLVRSRDRRVAREDRVAGEQAQ